jgi:archaea-specific DNA-binding protein
MSVEKHPEKRENTNFVFIGSKPLVNYVKSVLIQLDKSQESQVTIKSRGKFISKAVDVAEIVKRSPLPLNSKITIKNISTASETFKTRDKETNVSTMEITLSK